MRDCKCSFLLLWLAGLGYAGACVFRLGIDRAPWPNSTRQLAGASLEMIAAAGVFASLLVHARYVLHISPEPPENRPKLWARVFEAITNLFQKLPRPRLAFLFKLRRKPKTPTEKSSKKTQPAGKQKSQASAKPEARHNAKPAPAEKQASPAKPLTSPPKEEPKPTIAKTPPPAKQAPAESAGPSAAKSAPPPAEASKVQEERPAASRRSEGSQESQRPGASPRSSEPEAQVSKTKSPAEASNPPQLRVDPPLDPDQLKGLSKKERRKLRKQHRDAQRQGG